MTDRSMGPGHLVLVLCVLLVFVVRTHGAELKVSENASWQSVAESIDYLEEDGQRLNAKAVIDGARASDWHEADDEINFGYTDSAYWYRLSLRNPSPRKIERILEISYPLLDRVEFFEVRNGKVQERTVTGDHHPFGSRPLGHRTFAFPIDLDSGETSQVLLRVSTSGSHQLPLTLWQPAAFFEANEKDMVGRSMFYGMLVIIIIFNVFLYLVIGDRSYIYYVVTTVTLLTVLASLHGTAFQFLYPQYPQVNGLVTQVSGALIAFCFSFFARDFLNLDRTRPIPNAIFLGLMLISATNTVASLFISYNLSTLLSVVVAIITICMMLVVGILMAASGDRGARYFTLAWMVFLVGTMYWMLNLLGVIETSFWARYGVETGAVAQALLLTFGLGHRFNREREHRITEQQQRLRAMEEREALERDLCDQASHHNLTRLPGRNLLEAALERSIEKLEMEPEQQLALVLIHFRGFDDINKTLGHENADQLLCQLAHRMNDVVLRLSDTVVIEEVDGYQHGVAHVEGITFAAIFLPQRPESMVEQMEQLVSALRQPVEFRGLNLDVRMVGGCSFYPDDSEDVTTLLRHAFIAFDQADSDVSHVAVYTEDINPYSERRLTLMTQLRQAIQDDSLTLHFQPQVRVSSGEVCGFEVLLRWTHPEHGFIPPDEFIPMSEQTGLIKPLTQWVVNHSLAFCRLMLDSGLDIRISVNISALNLQEPGFADNIVTLLEHHGIEPSRLILEVTETATMINPKDALAALRSLHDAGIRLAIDDFGTGYSSLSYIRKLPVHEIKIDRSFVMEMDANRDDATIVRTTINMCHDLGFEVVAEGVESSNTCELLRTMSCDIIQGFHLARPMPDERVAPWLDEYVQNRRDEDG